MHLPAPFGKYELLERIATGGMAELYLARSFGVAGFEKHLVIKRIRPELADDPRFVQMFINEAKIGVHLNHPNVVQVYELGRVGRHYYIAMEHLHGRDLTRLVKTLRAVERRLPLPLAVAVVAEVCRGLAYAHGRTDKQGRLLGLVHQDVSPHNVLVTFTGEVKLVDFGIARLIHTAEGQAAHPEGRRPGGGKYAYMSPEQALGLPVDHRTDVFSAGIVLWELIVGHRLYQHDDPAEKLRLVQQAVIPHPGDEGVDIDDALWAILSRALTADREERYPSAAVLEEDLRAWLFESRQRVDRGDIAALMAQAFPEAADPTLDDIQLHQMVADLERLADRPDETTNTGTPTPAGIELHSDTATPSRLPGRLQLPNGERKTVTVLILDIDGLTGLSEHLDPEALFKRHYQILRWVRSITDRFGGKVQAAVDDQVTVLFGVPRNRVDDLHDALACALELQRRVGDLERKGMRVALAVGVHLGEVTVARRGHRIRFVARGDTRRLARKLASLADHGQVLVSERVLGAAEGQFTLRKGPPVVERGGRPPQASYILDGTRHAFRQRPKGPWLKRGDELERLRDAVVALGAGGGDALGLAGEPGAGKSRLLREIRDLALKRSFPFYGVRCSAEGTNRPMEPFRDLVAEVLGASADKAPTEALLDRTERLAQIGATPRDLEAIGALLGAQPRHQPDETEVWRALLRMLRGLAREAPLLLAIDDVHRLPAPEQRGLATLLEAAQDSPILFLLTHRGTAPEPLAARLKPVRLGPVPLDGQRRLLGHLLEAEVVDHRISDLVARTCEGNPYFIEEMTKYLIARGRVAVRDGVAILQPSATEGSTLPHSLAGLVAARIDALDPASKGVLQLAAIIGRDFDENLLAAAVGLDDPTPLVLDLAARGLIVRSAPGTWAFASELVHESALRGILGVQRRDCHRLVAHAYETLYGDQLEGKHEILARHCHWAGRHLDAARHAWAAGQQLEREHFLEQARSVYLLGIQALAVAGDDPDQWDARVQGDAMLHYRYGAVSLLLGDTQTGERALQLALDVSSDAGLPWIEVRAHLELGRSYAQRGKNRMANAHLGQARALVRFEDDVELQRETLEAAAGLAFDEGRNAEAEALWQEALQLAGDDAAARARCEIGLANRYLRCGEHAQAEPLLRSALQAARAAGDRILEGRVLNNIGLLHSWTGGLEKALEYYRKALEVREGIGYTRGIVVNHHNIGDTHFRAGDYARAWVAFERSRELAEEMGWPRGVVLNEIYLAHIDAIRGQADVEPLLEAIERARALGDAEIATAGAWLAGRYLIEERRFDEARDQLERALGEARAWDLLPMAGLIEEMLEGIHPEGTAD